ncbi:acetolactate synthase small subunit [Spirochaeta africana]|uniref:Acetolactate synthase small subunit n=1 Tax=Spirochaeta africana (strain ATCC 700263 / DSM 8902 / Z-7692) TaxID=889378 RepID=H9UJM9_SPIAZ|nr:acetolactate synthase small subunit [Spirochaeta africana]AFG37722.1 acetolactate synthase, small subunit [Spirochaeta africana DSM 8902]
MQNTIHTQEEKHTISLLVANKPGVLIRISLVFARRGYNIDSLVVSPSHRNEFSSMTIVASGDREVLHQILKQLNKLVDVIHATDRTGEDVIHREMALLKIHCGPEQRAEVLQLAAALACDTVDVSESTIILEITGTSLELDNVSQVMEPYGMLEMVRTGKVLMTRGAEQTA